MVISNLEKNNIGKGNENDGGCSISKGRQDRCIKVTVVQRLEGGEGVRCADV